MNKKREKVNIDKYIEYGKTDVQVLKELKKKYSDGVLDEIFDKYKDRKNLLIKRAATFADLITSRYHGLSPRAMLLKARKHAKKYGFSDELFQTFMHYALSGISAHEKAFDIKNTKMGNLLGFKDMFLGGRLNYSTIDAPIVQDIRKKAAMARGLFARVAKQSYVYQPPGTNLFGLGPQPGANPMSVATLPVVLAGPNTSPKFDVSPYGSTDKKKFDHKLSIYNHVHPVLFALFDPMIEKVDKLFLRANLGYVFECLYKGLPIATEPDFCLYQNLVMDTTNIGCNERPIVDYKRRVDLQCEIWDNVIALRERQYYKPDLNKFLAAVDACKNALYDSPDVALIKDAGQILRKIFSCVSFRPTYIALKPLSSINIASPGQGQQGVIGIRNITSIPVITVRLPYSNSNAPKTYKIEDMNASYEWYFQNKILTPYTKEVLFSDNILVYQVDRRKQAFKYGQMSNVMFFNKLPPTITGWEELDKADITDVVRTKHIGDSVYYLRSAVFDIEENLSGSNGTKVVVASGAVNWKIFDYLNNKRAPNFDTTVPAIAGAGAPFPISIGGKSGFSFFNEITSGEGAALGAAVDPGKIHRIEGNTINKYFMSPDFTNNNLYSDTAHNLPIGNYFGNNAIFIEQIYNPLNTAITPQFYLKAEYIPVYYLPLENKLEFNYGTATAPTMADEIYKSKGPPIYASACLSGTAYRLRTAGTILIYQKLK